MVAVVQLVPLVITSKNEDESGTRCMTEFRLYVEKIVVCLGKKNRLDTYNESE